jgi:hypothetical protein
MSIVDDLTRATWVYFLKQKSDAIAILKNFITMCERQYDVKVMRIRTDNGGEYVNKDLENFFKELGIIHDPTPPYSHESNGVAERLNRTIMNMVRAMLVKLDKRLWQEAVHTAVYLKNRLPHSAVKDQTPYEAFRGEKPTIQHLPPFGRECYIHIQVEKRPPGSKLLPRAEKGIFVGYTESIHIYKVFVPSRKHLFTSRDVKFPTSNSEGDTPSTSTGHAQQPQPIHTSIPPSSSTSPLTVTLNPEGFPSRAHWQQWCFRNPKQATSWFNKGVPNVHAVWYPGLQQQDGDDYLRIQNARNFTPHPDHNMIVPIDDESPTSSPPSPIIPIQQPDDFAPNDYERFSLMDLDTPHGSQPQPSDNQPPLQPQPILQQPVQQTRFGRIVKPPVRYGFDAPAPPAHVPEPVPPLDDNGDEDDVDAILVATALTSATGIEPEFPKTVKEAMSRPDADKWIAAMEEELDSLKQNDTWDIVDIPSNRKIVNCMWIFRIKYNSDGSIDRYKPRLVARGDSQVAGTDYDELFAPVVRFDSLRLLLAISASRNWRPRQLHVKTAFLYGHLKEEIYMRLPERRKIDGKVCNLKRCLYGLKQSPREWYARLTNYLLPY